ncbi:MAG TPA: L-glutamate gamma-semialdehyde dehydrogenase [Mycobacteriales bacterium]|nr:L-glutamate gamma-semialdehyde dehydrogenase [Mycobacteriales bacterium]
MLDATTVVPLPHNEPVRVYAPGTPERASLEARLKELGSETHDLTATVGGVQAMARGERIQVVQPHRHAAVLGITAESDAAEWSAAVDAALAAGPAWRDMSYDDRASIVLRAAELLAGPWRDTLNAATVLGQSKTVLQAEIDSACELIDFMRFNVAFGRQVLAEQPVSSAGMWNRMDHRPLEGFVLAITPFNFTAIAGNLPLAPALMGNTVVWKPSHTQQLAAHFTMRLLEAAGLPPGVINMVTGWGTSSDVALKHPALAGVHFTGSTRVFQHIWQTVGSRIGSYRTYPRLVGETGGKDFVLAHPSADPLALEVALVRGAFEYQGQKCSAASRAYVPRAMWEGGLRDALAARTESLTYGDVTDLSCFGGAVIDDRAFSRLSGVLDRAVTDPSLTVVAGGTHDDSEGWFVRPTVIETSEPRHDVMTTEYFGPVLGVFVYDDWDEVLPLVDTASPYALTGAVFAQDPYALAQAESALRFTAGNFYVNDKPTGAVVGQQPFGGARASGTNDKAGSVLNLLRWTSPRVLKTTFVPPHDHRYPHMG